MLPEAGAKARANPQLMANIIGMYVHEHWPYKHPYAARTWTLEDWRGYAYGLRALGYNTILIWPMIEMMSRPLTPSDDASLEKHARVIDLLHEELGMRVGIVLSPNVIGDERADRATFEARYFYRSVTLVNPGETAAVQNMMAWRETLLENFKAADAVVIIDSDPGGYPNSSNAEFVSLLRMHREMLDRLRVGIELNYWAWFGWRAWGRFRESGIIQVGTEADFLDTLSHLKKSHLEPWGLASGRPESLQYAEVAGVSSRAIYFSYGPIEPEPSMPMTRFDGAVAYAGGAQRGPRGVIGNAQTHCVQLPNTFAFARGALGMPLTDQDYVEFADRLIRDRGQLIARSWKALASADGEMMLMMAAELRSAMDSSFELGDLRGLVFGSGRRFIEDLVLQLELQAAYQEFVKSERKQSLGRFVETAEAWQRQHGYQGIWIGWPGMWKALRRVGSEEINAVLNIWSNIRYCKSAGEELPDGAPEECDGEAHPGTPETVASALAAMEDFTPRLLAAMRSSLSSASQ